MTATLPAIMETEPEVGMVEGDSSMYELEWKSPQISRSATENRNRPLDLDSYQIALVPFRMADARKRAKLAANRGLEQVLILSLTWKQLVARVRNEMRRSSLTTEKEVVQFGKVHIDFSTMEVRRSDRLVSLTAMEFKVLKFFVSNAYRVISREDLLNHVWGYDSYPCTRTVDNHVLKLRQKLEADISRPVHFRTVHRIGYKFIP